MSNPNAITNLSDFRKESAAELSVLINDLKEHNSHQGPGAQMGRAMARMLGAVIEGEQPNIPKAQAEVALESAREARIGLGELKTKHERTLARFGLNIAHEQSKSLQYGLPSGPISMRIENVHSFLKYAQSIKPLARTDDTTANPFNTLLDSVMQQIAAIDFMHVSPIDRSMLENLDALAGAFRKIDPNLDLSRLEHYALFNKTNRLPNYIAVERENLWQNPGKGFGPADWVKDISPANLDSYWQKAVEVLKDQYRLHNQGGVGYELRDHLLFCIDKAAENLEQIPWSASYDHKEDFEKILKKYKAEISQIDI